MDAAPQTQFVGLALFDTAIGRCGIAWCGDLIRASMLPASSDDRTLARLSEKAGGGLSTEVSETVRRAIAAITALLAGEAVDLSFVDCDMQRVNSFEASVYGIARSIVPGQTLTYGDIAQRLGDKQLSRAVGGALGRNLWPIIVPCHRVVGASGKLTGFSATGGVVTKQRLLEIERARENPSPSLFADLPLVPKAPPSTNRSYRS